ncbi:hypothetical protein PtA15_15A256 [Puccinia triticina]|uniref:Glucose 1-dehydrogenase n=1 Tax=Puccinia triticina TaxID=208348 RepID=A0ABY7D2M5_9BASI|nr:uncharacterized protein PtA15_15A256 [Puccinia triticina]WAQ91864.1 hypothetical protein PtA15_15A256 [Puccinia triticina]
MPGRLEHRVAVITGGGSGIGMESSLLFASEGCQVIVADIDVLAAARTVARILVASADKCPAPMAFQCDVGKEEDVKALVDKAVEVGGRLDVIFNNAGIMHPDDSDAVQTEEKIWDLTMRVNCKGVWWGCKYGIQAMLANPVDEGKGLKRGGSIINTASFVAKLGAATPQLAYTASKGAVLAMTRELAMVHARDGIRVNALCAAHVEELVRISNKVEIAQGWITYRDLRDIAWSSTPHIRAAMFKGEDPDRAEAGYPEDVEVAIEKLCSNLRELIHPDLKTPKPPQNTQPKPPQNTQPKPPQNTQPKPPQNTQNLL